MSTMVNPGDRVEVTSGGAAFDGQEGTVMVDDPEYPVGLTGYDAWVELDSGGVYAFAYSELRKVKPDPT